LTLTIILAGLIYCLALYLLGGIRRQDLETIFKRQNKSGGQIYGQGSNL